MKTSQSSLLIKNAYCYIPEELPFGWLGLAGGDSLAGGYRCGGGGGQEENSLDTQNMYQIEGNHSLASYKKEPDK
jgi:hypothetical protein